MLRYKSLITFVFNIANSAISFLSVYFIARNMGPEAFGIISVSLAFINLFTIFGDFGLSSAHIKKVSEGLDLGICNGTYFTLRTASTLLMGALCLGGFFIVKMIDSGYFANDSVFFLLLLSTVLLALFDPIRITFQARMESFKESFSNFIQRTALSASKLIVAIGGLNVVALASANLFSTMVFIVVILYFFKGYPLKRFNFLFAKDYLYFGVPIMFTGIIEILFQNIDKLLLNSFVEESLIGQYTAGQSLLQPLFLFSSVLFGLLFPKYSALFKESRIDEIRELALLTERYLAIALSPVFAFIILNSSDIIHLFLGDKFTETSFVLSLYSFYLLILILSQPYTSQLFGAGKSKDVFRISFYSFILYIILSFILIPHKILGIQLLGLGISGAVISLVIVGVFSIYQYRLWAFKLSQVKGSKRVIFYFAIPIMLNAVLIHFGFFLEYSTFIRLMLHFSLTSFLYTLFLFWTKDLTKDDLQFYVSILNLNKMLSYIKSEVGSVNVKQ